MVSLISTSARRDRRLGRLLALLALAGVVVAGLESEAAQAQQMRQPSPATPVDTPAPPSSDDEDGADNGLSTATLQAATQARVAGTGARDEDAASDLSSGGRIGRAGDAPAVGDDLARLNQREGSVDGLRTRLDPTRNDAPGIRLGTFTLKPSINQSINVENRRDGASREHRGYLETGVNATLTSDWSRHQLTVTGQGAWQKNISGEGATDPFVDIDADLRLDVSHQTTAHLKAGYRVEREDASDPNAVANATTQSTVQQFSLGSSIEHDFGILRGSARLDGTRYAYGDVELDNGTTLSLKDRNRNVGVATGRLGYELSPALIPFIEASLGRGLYDERRDISGYERSYTSWGGRGGLQVDFGEKLGGELALGYGHYGFDDGRLRDIGALTVDGLVNWSPQRGTNIATSLTTALEPSTTAGESGAIAYSLTSRATRELRNALVARLSGGLTLRNYPSGSATPDERVWFAGAGLTWDINRALALTGDISYERTLRDSGINAGIAKIGIGLTMRR
ncbi:hypothetical protein BJF93_03040 [Xaviernesmea oryzae]|uniref:Outer membrane beta-barrel protein n=1 Tax=Xaviernesmea oryzae TaxID=464029 RepID=A0A1Q9AZD2_9HYPH|nr:outer membrane beta-barrel protein [Xaviernesmea oryzae]OLP61050.1 hypothetical protein BJF93_03040 [Xaviernesmea oryzae]SEL15653.1 hypothetical protein SAMN04487976_106100 [Xaviernesmea oryzae]